jgi:hypothetical protein
MDTVVHGATKPLVIVHADYGIVDMDIVSMGLVSVTLAIQEQAV